MPSLSPKLKRNVNRIIPFGLIWLFTSWVFLLNDVSISRNQNLNPETDITLTVPVVIFASLAILFLGLLVGAMEMVVLEKKFSNYSLLGKITSKFFIYLGILMGTILFTYPIASSIDLGTNPFSPEIWDKFRRFVMSITFLNTLVQLSFSLLLCLFYSAISENLGHNVLINFFTGKYHKPKVERRIFMFLDMKDSTTIAEKLGHIAYFDFLRMYYDAMSDSIIKYHGEVYQYIGDEVVISWSAEQGLAEENCIRCFFSLKESLSSMKQNFIKQFGISPDFKAGMHIGEASVGEIGALKKEIVYSGDVLNTAARIQSLCKTYHRDLIISEDLATTFSNPSYFKTTLLDEVVLSGKSDSTKIFGIYIK